MAIEQINIDAVDPEWYEEKLIAQAIFYDRIRSGTTSLPLDLRLSLPGTDGIPQHLSVRVGLGDLALPDDLF